MAEVPSVISSTPPGKKLKQARLPFAPVNKQKGKVKTKLSVRVLILERLHIGVCPKFGHPSPSLKS